MNKSKKILLLSILPGLLTLLFIFYIVVPSVSRMNQAKKALEEEKASYKETQNQITNFKVNNTLLKQVVKLREELSNFDIQIPPDDELAILLIDLQKFASSYNIKILNFTAGTPKNVEIVDPKLSGKNAKKKSKKKVVEEDPFKLFSIPIKIEINGYYGDILNFINNIERYQRKIVINSINLQTNSDDKGKIIPRTVMSLDCNVYKGTIQETNLKDKDSTKSKSDKEGSL